MTKFLKLLVIFGLLPSPGEPLLLQKDLRNVSFIKLPTESITNLILGHNGLRNRMAFNTNKSASNMNLIHWDMEMVFKSKYWIHRCFSTRAPPRYCKVAQYPGINRLQLKALRSSWEFSSIRIWFSPYRVTPDREIDHLTQPSTFTQLIWASVQTFGCALAHIDQDFFIVVCAYDPPGNGIREQVYKTGKPCSQCDDIDVCSAFFGGLCGVDKSSAARKVSNLWIFPLMLCAINWAHIRRLQPNCW